MTYGICRICGSLLRPFANACTVCGFEDEPEFDDRLPGEMKLADGKSNLFNDGELGTELNDEDLYS